MPSGKVINLKTKGHRRKEVVTIYHNPNSGISREVLALILSSGVAPLVVDYLKTPPSSARLKYLARKMGVPVRRLVRKSVEFADFDLGNPKWNDDALLDFMVRAPELIVHPIVESSKGVLVCRPAELVLSLLGPSLRQSASHALLSDSVIDESDSSLHMVSQPQYESSKARGVLMSHSDGPQKVIPFEHPGEGKRRAKPTPKGRQIDPQASEEIEFLLEGKPRRRDMLIEYLHLIQDRYHQISAAHLAALADEMKLAFSEVFETATFYAHFDVVKEGSPDIAPLTIRVCDSLTCAMLGAETLLKELQNKSGPGVRVVRAPCVGRCDTAPAAEVGHNFIDHATVENVLAAAKEHDTHVHVPDYVGYESYVAQGGYALLNSLRSGKTSKEDILKVLDDASLRGLGGAGFPTGRKWRAVLGEPGPRLMAINGDEGEPGTFKDRFYLETDPHRFIEGMLIGAHIVDAQEVYIYLRDEYPACREIIAREIAQLPPGGPTLHMRRGAGAYICGEESSLLESIEGKRGLPRHKPPYPFQVGLFGLPTLINNVETLFWVRDLVEKGADWWKSQGRNDRHGLRSYSVSGRVKEPGVKLAPAGVTIKELIEEFCGGMADGHQFRAYLPGGASGGILPASMNDIPLDFGTLEKYGCFIGSAAVVVLSDKDDVKDAALNLMKFFEDESCGQCTPCRVGTEKAVKLMETRAWNRDLLNELSQTMRDASICGLGQAASNPLTSVIKYFPEEFAPQEAAE
jgi:formate dehydrogenase